jgi:solute carrier family 13 (sodium-dependent dicarboxylate transporter), member 2/3/5
MSEDQARTRTDVDKALLGHATYRSLGEQRLSPAEEKFEKGRRTVGLWLAPLVTIVFLALPLEHLARRHRAVGHRGGADSDRRVDRGRPHRVVAGRAS